MGLSVLVQTSPWSGTERAAVHLAGLVLAPPLLSPRSTRDPLPGQQQATCSAMGCTQKAVNSRALLSGQSDSRSLCRPQCAVVSELMGLVQGRCSAGLGAVLWNKACL